MMDGRLTRSLAAWRKTARLLTLYSRPLLGVSTVSDRGLRLLEIDCLIGKGSACLTIDQELAGSIPGIYTVLNMD